MSREYFILNSEWTDSKRVKLEREKAKKLKKTNWWHEKLNKGICEYCGLVFKSYELTMDHKVPIARGGISEKGNIVVSCKPCNQSKGLQTPVDLLLNELKKK